MEHSCRQCGAMIPDGAPFCRNCQAPQIRVATPEPVPTEISGSAATAMSPMRSSRLVWAHAFPAAFIGALCSAAVMIFPLGLFGIGIIAGGAISAISYRRRLASPPLSLGLGARLGAISGLLGFALFSIALCSTVLLSRSQAKVRQMIFEALDQSAAARAGDPQVQQIVAQLKSPEGFVFLLALSFAFLLVFFVILSALGGAIGTTLKRNQDS